MTFSVWNSLNIDFAMNENIWTSKSFNEKPKKAISFRSISYYESICAWNFKINSSYECYDICPFIWYHRFKIWHLMTEKLAVEWTFLKPQTPAKRGRYQSSLSIETLTAFSNCINSRVQNKKSIISNKCYDNWPFIWYH